MDSNNYTTALRGSHAYKSPLVEAVEHIRLVHTPHEFIKVRFKTFALEQHFELRITFYNHCAVR